MQVTKAMDIKKCPEPGLQFLEAMNGVLDAFLRFQDPVLALDEDLLRCWVGTCEGPHVAGQD